MRDHFGEPWVKNKLFLWPVLENTFFHQRLALQVKKICLSFFCIVQCFNLGSSICRVKKLLSISPFGTKVSFVALKSILSNNFYRKTCPKLLFIKFQSLQVHIRYFIKKINLLIYAKMSNLPLKKSNLPFLTSVLLFSSW